MKGRLTSPTADKYTGKRKIQVEPSLSCDLHFGFPTPGRLNVLPISVAPHNAFLKIINRPA